MGSTITVSRRRIAAVSTCVALVLLGSLAAVSLADSVATTGAATSVGTTSATLHGTVNAGSVETSWSFQYGKTTSYDQHTPIHVVASGSQQVSATITGLSPGTTYHFRLLAGQGSYSTTFHTGADATFTTGTSSTVTVTTGRATSLSGTGALLNGKIDAGADNTKWAFQYGPTKSYGKLTPLKSVSAGLHSLSARISGLSPGHRYHFRLVASDAGFNRFFVGSDATFVTSSGNGRTSLVSKNVRVHNKAGSVALRCSGSAGALCKGRIQLSMSPKFGSHQAHFVCGSGSWTASAGHTHVVKVSISAECLNTLAVVAGHKFPAALVGTFTTHQSPLRTTVTLALG